MKNPEELRESLIDDLDQFDKDYLIKSIICFLRSFSKLEDLKDSIDREIFLKMKNNRFGQAKVLDTNELDLITNYLPSNFQSTISSSRLLRNTGARIGEVVQLRWRDIGRRSNPISCNNH